VEQSETFSREERFQPVVVVMHADVERPLAVDSRFLEDMLMLRGEGKPEVYVATTRKPMVKRSGCSVV
jgi:hypothetical protein